MAGLWLAVANAALAQSSPSAPPPNSADAPASPAAPTAAATLNEVVVTGYRKSLASALQAKRDDIRITDGISAEDIGKFPTENIAEAIERIPGVQMSNINGRGSTISVRGLGPQYSNVTVNGQDFKSADYTDGFRFDIIQTELASAIQVIKSPSADLDAGGLAGTINIDTVHPLAKKGEELVLTSEAQYSDFSKGAVTPKGAVSYVNQFLDGKLGVFLGAAYQELNDRSDTLFMDKYFQDVQPDGSTLFTPQRLRYRRIDRYSDRTQFNLGLQAKPIDGLELGLIGIYSRDDTKYDDGQEVFGFSESNETPLTTVNHTVTKLNITGIGDDNNRQLEVRDYTSEGVNLFGKWTGWNKWTIKGALNYTDGKAYLTEEAAIASIGIASGFLDISNPSDIKFAPSANLTSPALFAASALTYDDYPDGAQHRDNSGETAAQIDAKYQADAGILSSVDFGAKFKRETFSRYTTRHDSQYIGFLTPSETPVYGSSNYLVTDFLGGADAIPHSWIDPDINAYRKTLAASGVVIPYQFAPEDSYNLSRDIYAAYAMANLKGNIFSFPYRGNVGLRFESTSQQINGFKTTDNPNPNATTTLETGTYTSNMSYSNVLPSANLVVDLEKNLLLRLAAAQVLVRTILDTNSSLATSTTQSSSAQGTTYTIALGDAGLKPLTANQVDAGLEYYYGRGNGVSIAGFFKAVKNGTYTSTVCPKTYNGVALSLSSGTCYGSNGAEYDITATANDSSTVNILGGEFSWQQSLDQFLPIKGFGLQTNYTYVQPEKQNGGFTLRNLSSNTINATGYWESHGFSARLSANYRSHYYQNSADSFFARQGHTIEGRTQLDGFLAYNFTRNMTLSFGVLNILNADSEDAYAGEASRWQETQVTGRNYYLALQFKQ
jgi:TonB-dependent receptor